MNAGGFWGDGRVIDEPENATQSSDGTVHDTTVHDAPASVHAAHVAATEQTGSGAEEAGPGDSRPDLAGSIQAGSAHASGGAAEDAPAEGETIPPEAVQEATPEPEAAPSEPSPVLVRQAPESLGPPVRPEPTGARDWYILKVQSNREDSIREALQRRIHREGLDDFFGDIIVPIEMVSEFKNGKKRVVKRKLYPGYLVVHMELNEDTWFLVRETHGIGDFTGSGGKPSPMLPHEVNRILSKQEEKTDEAPKLNIKFRPGDRVKIIEGTFENFEGDVDAIDEANGRVTVMINIFGRSTPVELEYWQVETI
jgi:transcriptional antiterminator NusG